VTPEPMGGQAGHVLVLGNEKGGSGKSTTAMHLIAALMADGHAVAAIDLDTRQRSLTRYLENRRDFAAAGVAPLPMPSCRPVEPATHDSAEAAHADEAARFGDTLDRARREHGVVVIDCPGSDTHLARLAHAAADTILTPLNDSYVDLDLLARIDRDSFAIAGPSLYAEMVWEARKRRAMRDGGHIDWVVMRNRVSALKARNKARVASTLEELAGRIGFRFLPGLSERVIYRELFPKGLTLVDLRLPGVRERTGGMTMSHVTARAEVRRLVEGLALSAPAGRLEAAE